MAVSKSYLNAFSPNYFAARSRFRSLALAANARLECHAIEAKASNGEELTIDVATLGAIAPQKVIVVSSGLHGVEGFFGSAVQIALLKGTNLKDNLPADAALVMLHGLNPYGFAEVRRTNEDNIDLNRNFLLAGATYRGCPPDYPKFDRFFNPISRRSRLDLFYLKALWLIGRYGMNSLKNTLPVGQYEFAKGLFFGGHFPSKTQTILDTYLPHWLGNSTEIVHLDFHTGLGNKGTYQLFVEDSLKSPKVKFLQHHFGKQAILAADSSPDIYTMRGTLGKWIEAKFPQKNYQFLTAEFGTYSVIEVVKALRAENFAHWWGDRDTPFYRRSKQQLLEIFAPKEPRWRNKVVEQGIDLVQKAIALLSQTPSTNESRAIDI